MKEDEKPLKTMCYHVGDLKINLSERRVYRHNTLLSLPELSFDLFAKLIQEAPNPVERDVLVNQVWHSKFVHEDTIVQRVAMLRKALGDDPKTPRYIRTVRGLGYAILADVVPVYEHAKCSVEHAEQSNSKQFAQFKKIQSLSVAALIVLSLFIMAWFNDSAPKDKMKQLIQSNDDKLNAQARQLLSVWQPDETEHAIELLKELLHRNPHHIQAKLTLSFALSTRETKFGGSLADAIEAEMLARDILKQRPESGVAWHALGYALDAQSRIEEALLAYQKAYEIDASDTTAMSSAAHLMFVKGRLYEALQLELKGLQSNDSSIFAELQIAKTLQLLDMDSSEYWWHEAEKLPLNAVVYDKERIQSYLSYGNFSSAETLIEKSLLTRPRSNKISYLYARLWLQKGEIEKAKEQFTLLGDIATADLAALDALNNDKANALIQINQLNDVIYQGNTWPQLRITLAELYAASGEDNQSVQFLNQAVDLGWRDIRFIETSPFLSKIVLSNEWLVLKKRIQQEVNAQKELVIQTPELAQLLNK